MLLHFTDERGIEWQVWEVGVRPLPADHAPAPVPAGASPRWLCFESATERRRLSQYPEQWHALPPAELAALCGVAHTARVTTIGGVVAPDPRRGRPAEPRPERDADRR